MRHCPVLARPPGGDLILISRRSRSMGAQSTGEELVRPGFRVTKQDGASHGTARLRRRRVVGWRSTSRTCRRGACMLVLTGTGRAERTGTALVRDADAPCATGMFGGGQVIAVGFALSGSLGRVAIGPRGRQARRWLEEVSVSDPSFDRRPHSS